MCIYVRYLVFTTAEFREVPKKVGLSGIQIHDH